MSGCDHLVDQIRRQGTARYIFPLSPCDAVPIGHRPRPWSGRCRWRGFHRRLPSCPGQSGMERPAHLPRRRAGRHARRSGRQVGLTQPTMGWRLRALERAAGHTLFQRTGYGFILTEEGNAVLACAERMEKEALWLTRALAGSGNALTGPLRVSLELVTIECGKTVSRRNWPMPNHEPRCCVNTQS